MWLTQLVRNHHAQHGHGVVSVSSVKRLRRDGLAEGGCMLQVLALLQAFLSSAGCQYTHMSIHSLIYFAC